MTDELHGYHYIKKTKENGVLFEIWKETDSTDATPNSWKLIKSEWKEDKPDNRPVWVDTWEEYDKLKKEGKNVHKKSKPSTGPTFINEKGEICMRHYDEYDHCYTMRMDNPMGLNAEQADKMMKDLTKGCKKDEK